MSARKHIADCIRHCADAKDGRGRWRAQRTAQQALQRPFDSEVIARATAEATAGIMRGFTGP